MNVVWYIYLGATSERNLAILASMHFLLFYPCLAPSLLSVTALPDFVFISLGRMMFFWQMLFVIGRSEDINKRVGKYDME